MYWLSLMAMGVPPNKSTLYIFKSKNGKSKTIPLWKLNVQQQQIIRAIYNYYKEKGLDQNQRIFPHKDGSYSSAFRRIRNSLTGKKYNQCSIHSMRKEFAK
ncbi:hypothetical protein OW763_16425 [Clostridium aestuarii]|uniref:Tyr recombinase domain-containing protein n=1 Tax=Clostridium aestuarii TaxID=338193 RepID=A0ABT4D3T6_9CLOT|nr:hypothetical protein [Clostridium aestuarii]MCY6485898.1 hypothetical protein [Clostridium aestuarii]